MKAVDPEKLKEEDLPADDANGRKEPPMPKKVQKGNPFIIQK